MVKPITRRKGNDMTGDDGMIAVTGDKEYCVTYFAYRKEWTLKCVAFGSRLFGVPYYTDMETTKIEQVAAQWMIDYGMKTLSELPTIMEIHKAV